MAGLSHAADLKRFSIQIRPKHRRQFPIRNQPPFPPPRVGPNLSKPFGSVRGPGSIDLETSIPSDARNDNLLHGAKRLWRGTCFKCLQG